MASPTKNFFTALTGIAIGAWLLAGAMVAGIVIDAFLLKTLWGWFVVPQFGLAALTVPLAGGLVTIAYLLRGASYDKKPVRDEDADEDDDSPQALRRNIEDLRQTLLSLVLRPILILGVGWLLTVFM
jgi:hypothetical protein